MRYQVPEIFLRLRILLPANMTVPSINNRLTIQAYLFLSFGEMRHVKV
jgi:hypothetical protein